SADEDLHLIDRIELSDSILGQDVHHSWCEPAVGDDRDSFPARFGIELLLREDDLGVSSDVAEMDPRGNRLLGDVEIEVVGYRAHYGIGFAHQGADGFMIANVERSRNETLSRVGREEIGQVACVQVGQPAFRDFVVLQQIIRACRALQPGTEDKHTHQVESPFAINSVLFALLEPKANRGDYAAVTPARSLQTAAS